MAATTTPLLPQLERAFSTATMTSPQRLLIAGCGRLGRVIISCNAATGHSHQITALQRSTSIIDGAESYPADLGNSSELLALGQRPYDAVVYCPAPDQRTPLAYRQTYLYGLQNLLTCGALKAAGKLIFVSSTAVYGQDDGSHVDEQSETRPQGFNGQILLQAEQHALHWPAVASGQRCCVRLAGLYQELPARYLQMLAQPPDASAALQHWTNRIHLQDAAQLILLLLMHASMPPLINGVDNEPSRLLDVLRWLATEQQSSWPEPHEDQLPSSQQRGKRISNALAHSLGFVPTYPSFRAGFSNQSTAVTTEQ